MISQKVKTFEMFSEQCVDCYSFAKIGKKGLSSKSFKEKIRIGSR